MNARRHLRDDGIAVGAAVVPLGREPHEPADECRVQLAALSRRRIRQGRIGPKVVLWACPAQGPIPPRAPARAWPCPDVDRSMPRRRCRPALPATVSPCPLAACSPVLPRAPSLASPALHVPCQLRPLPPKSAVSPVSASQASCEACPERQTECRCSRDFSAAFYARRSRAMRDPSGSTGPASGVGHHGQSNFARVRIIRARCLGR